MAWRDRWLAVILARSFIACLPRRPGRDHAGDETCEDLERCDARGSSSCSHAVADGAAGKGFGGRSGRLRKARFSCMVALLALHRLDGSVVESVNDLAQVEQIAKPAEIVGTTSIVRRRSPCLLGVPIGPVGRNQRAATVWQDHENEEDAAPPDAADHGQRLAFEGVALAGDGQRIWNITVMGSLWPLPSIRSV